MNLVARLFRQTNLKQNGLAFLDRLGMSLSLICAIHCVLTPVVILSLPIMARFYVAHPWFHWLIAILIVPVGLWAFISGYRHHGRSIVLKLGIPGLIIIGFVPVFFHTSLNWWSEPLLMICGSSLLISAHWINRKSCACDIHGHGHNPT